MYRGRWNAPFVVRADLRRAGNGGSAEATDTVETGGRTLEGGGAGVEAETSDDGTTGAIVAAELKGNLVGETGVVTEIDGACEAFVDVVVAIRIAS
jgi:hypothetical protein